MPRNAEPGFAQTYSNWSALNTSTMKSAPGRSVICSSTLGSLAASCGGGVSASLALDGTAAAAAAAEPSAFDRKRRRPGSTPSWDILVGYYTIGAASMVWLQISDARVSAQFGRKADFGWSVEPVAPRNDSAQAFPSKTILSPWSNGNRTYDGFVMGYMRAILQRALG